MLRRASAAAVGAIIETDTCGGHNRHCMAWQIPGVKRDVEHAQDDYEGADDREGEVGPTAESERRM